MSDSFRETLSWIAGVAFLVWALLILFGVIPRWLWKPLRARQSEQGFQEPAVSYSLADVAVLIVYIGIVFAATSRMRNDPSSSAGAAVLAVSLSLLTLALWFVGLRVLRRADIRSPGRRLTFQFAVLPMATLGAFLLGVGAFFLVMEALMTHPPQTPDELVAITAISLSGIAVCRPLSRWIASEPPSPSRSAIPPHP